MEDGKKKTEAESHLSEMARVALQDSERWFGDSGVTGSLGFHVLALAGEVGELANIVKKIERGSLDPRDAGVRYQLMMETTDVFTYLLLVAGILRLDLDKSYLHVRGLNENRFMAQRLAREAVKNNGNG